MFSLVTEKVKLNLEIVPIDSLLLHEEVIPEAVDRLYMEFKNWASLQNPLIVDENNIVLDGNHRAFVFKLMKLKFVAVCRINYFSPGVQLRYWFRLLEGMGDTDRLRSLIGEVGGSLHPVSDRDTLGKILKAERFCCGLQCRSGFEQIRFPERRVNDAVTAYGVLQDIQEELLHQGASLTFVPCQMTHEQEICRPFENDGVMIWTPQITKQMVVAAARSGQVFAPKTTRHLIHARPINVDVPTYWFDDDVTLEEINARFEAYLQKKQVRKLGPGQIIDGRYYGEHLFVFYEPNGKNTPKREKQNE